MTRYRVLPYKQGSRSAKALADALGGKVLKLVGSKFVPKPDDVIINWGKSNEPWDMWGCRVFNSSNLHNVSNKLKFFQLMKDKEPTIIPKFWTSKEEVQNEYQGSYPIVCRTLLSSHSGAGIVIANSFDDLVDAPLFVEYKKKRDEYRVHVCVEPWKPHLDYSGEPMNQGEYRDYPVTIIAVQRKARRLETPYEEVNWQVRNHSNGFVFVRNNVNPPPAVLDVARRALLASGLDFGAVDVIWNENEQKAYVLEINTAPGLEGQTVEDYASFFRLS